MRQKGLKHMSVIENIMDIPAQYTSEIFGQFDSNIKKIEKTLHLTIIARDSELKIIGGENNVLRAKKIIESLCDSAKKGNPINEQVVNYAISLAFDNKTETLAELDEDIICRTLDRKSTRLNSSH